MLVTHPVAPPTAGVRRRDQRRGLERCSATVGAPSGGRRGRGAPHAVAGRASVRCASRRRDSDDDDSRGTGEGEAKSVLDRVAAVWRTTEPVLDTAASLLPESLPRPLAKLAVTALGVAALWLGATTLLNTFASLVFVVALVTVAFTISGSGAASGSGGGRGSEASSRDADGDDDGDDPLVRARKIMDKYK